MPGVMGDSTWREYAKDQAAQRLPFLLHNFTSPFSIHVLLLVDAYDQLFISFIVI